MSAKVGEVDPQLKEVSDNEEEEAEIVEDSDKEDSEVEEDEPESEPEATEGEQPDITVLDIFENLAKTKVPDSKKLVWTSPKDLSTCLKQLKKDASVVKSLPLIYYQNDSQMKGGVYQILTNCLSGNSKLSWVKLIKMCEDHSGSMKFFALSRLAEEVKRVVTIQLDVLKEEDTSSTNLSQPSKKRKLDLTGEIATNSKVSRLSQGSIKKKTLNTSISSTIARTVAEPVTARSLIDSIFSQQGDFDDGCQVKYKDSQKTLQRISYNDPKQTTSYTKEPQVSDAVITFAMYEGGALIHHGQKYWTKNVMKATLDVQNRQDADILRICKTLNQAILAKVKRDSENGQQWEKNVSYNNRN